MAAYGDRKAGGRIFYGRSARVRSKKVIEEVPIIVLTVMTAHHQWHSMAHWR